VILLQPAGGIFPQAPRQIQHQQDNDNLESAFRLWLTPAWWMSDLAEAERMVPLPGAMNEIVD
jgi:hypothetical protein